MDLASLLHAASFRPERVVAPPSWVGHIPFAAWLMPEVGPAVFVELGTHSGNSYLAFCQSVREAGLATKCYAVDTWRGDEHSGAYAEEVFSALNRYHEQRYAGFSQLLRTTFDEAAGHFTQGSVGLLHIDGLHTYEAVLHDFETWLPKLSRDAVVLFHDTNVRERGFGVYRLWEELRREYPLHLEFTHSHGLVRASAASWRRQQPAELARGRKRRGEAAGRVFCGPGRTRARLLRRRKRP